MTEKESNNPLPWDDKGLDLQLNKVKERLKALASDNKAFKNECRDLDLTEIIETLEQQRIRSREFVNHLATVSAESTELLVELEEKNELLSKSNEDLASANAHAAELMAEIELKNDEIQSLNKALGNANAYASEIVAELEERKEEINEKNTQYETLVSNIPGIVYRCKNDPEPMMTFLSNEVESITGYPKDTLINNTNRSFTSIIHNDDKARVKRAIQKGINCKKSYVIDYRIINKNKDIRWVNEKGRGIFSDNGELRYLDGTIHDITDRKNAEKIQSKLFEEIQFKNKELQHFAYIVSHDLKTPLRAISSLAGWIHKDYFNKLDDSGREQLDLLQNRVSHLNKLIDSILQYSRIGRKQEEKMEIDLNTLVPEIINVIDPPNNIDIKVNKKLPTIVFEPTRIEQIFQNLLTNATKYMDKDHGMITVDVSKDNNYWKFSIADNGPGIDEKFYEQIFQIFQTLQTKTEVDSTGIGLTIVKKIVDNYGGKIWVESQVGEGATFYFTIPLDGSQGGLCE